MPRPFAYVCQPPTPGTPAAAAGLALTALSLPMLSLGGRRSSVAASLLLHGAGYAFKDASTHGLLADLVDAHGAEGSYAMAFALADVADSAGYIVGPPLGAALGAALGSRTKGLALSGLGVLAAVPVTRPQDIAFKGSIPLCRLEQ